MAQDFRNSNGVFTPYGAFSEACADYGLNEAPVYQAAYRVNRLYTVLGYSQQDLIQSACSGDVPAYQTVVTEYNQAVGQTSAFVRLFPPYR